VSESVTERGLANILIVGGGTAGWMTAAALARKLSGLPITIRLVESAEIGTVGVGEATVPHIRFFNAALGLDEADFVARTKATFKLGIEFRNWGRIGDSYIHPFGAFGRDIAGIPFHQHWSRMRAAGDSTPLDHYSLPTLAARGDRFSHPDPDPHAIGSTFSYAYQFDAGLYAAYLRSYAEARGVERIEGKITDVRLDAETGFIESIMLESGRLLDAHLFVDCSGFRSLLVGQALGADFEDWSHWLPCDRAIALPCEQGESLTPYTRSTARESGWLWRIPLQHRVGNGHVYASAYISDDEAEATLLAQLEGKPLSSPNRLRFKAGKRSRQWIGNCVSIGLSAGFLEPLESTSIHLIQLGITHLIELLPDRAWDPADAEEFNRLMALEYERVRDFIILHYCATERSDTSFWNYCREMSVPDSLQYRIEMFRERGIVVNYREGMFLEPSWIAVFLGQNVVPRRHHPLSERIPEPQLRQRMQAIAAEVSAAAERMPLHADFLAALTARSAAMAG
jgi:tryptophan 7-halogenase